MMLRHHWRDGWWFHREAGGYVSIHAPAEHGDGRHEPPVAVIPPDEWASIVAAVSADEGTIRSWVAAKALHNGERLQVAEPTNTSDDVLTDGAKLGPESDRYDVPPGPPQPPPTQPMVG